MTVMVPTMIGMLLQPPDVPTRSASRSLRTLTYGASPMPARAARPSAREPSPTRHLPGVRHDRIVGRAHRARPRRAPGRRRACCARRVARCRVSCCRSRTRTATILPAGETGEVCARGGNFMREYWNQPEATEEAFRDGWYHTGDAGYLDERRLPVPRRPGEGHDRDRRRERVLGRGRERDRDRTRRSRRSR